MFDAIIASNENKTTLILDTILVMICLCDQCVGTLPSSLQVKGNSLRLRRCIINYQIF